MGKATILVVDDEQNICKLIKVYLADEFEVVAAYNGQEGWQAYKQGAFDLIILDVMLPGINGWDLCRLIRKDSDVPVIMLSAKDEDYDRILGLELGADDYLTKPFNPKELEVRVKAVLRRVPGISKGQAEVLELDSFYINKVTQQTIILGQELDLTPKEFDLVWFLASHLGIVFNREQLIQKVWGYNFLGESRAIDSAIKRLRRKLEAVPGVPFYIQTVWGVGYKFAMHGAKSTCL